MQRVLRSLLPGVLGLACLVHALPLSAQSAGAPTLAPPTAQPASQASAPPRLLRFVEAEYPAEARAAGLEANVVLLLTIDPTGRVAEASVVEGAGHGFDEAALVAARQFEFAPAQQGGRPVAARIRYRYRFTLRTAAQPEAPRSPAAVLRGTVRDAQNRAVAGATVTVVLDALQEPLTQTTDAAGGFRFELPAAGAATVTVAREGFRAFRAEERLHPRDDVQALYRLTPLPTATTAPTPASDPEPEEEGITVRGQRPAREVTRTTLDRREVMRIPGTGGDALRAIQNLPGLSRAPFLSGALVVRGAAPADTNVFADGTELPLLYHFGGLSSVIQTEMLDRIDFYPGNFSSRFGRAMGGTVDVGLRSPRRRGHRGVVNLNAIDGSFFVEGAVTPELSFAVAARRSWVDVVLGAVLSNVEGVNVTAAPVYYDYQAVLEWRPSPAHRLRLALFGDDDTLSILFRRPGDNAPTFAGRVSLATRFHLAQLSYTHDFAPGTQGRGMLSAGWTNVEFAGGEQFSLAVSVVPVNFRYELAHSLSPVARVNTGFDVVFAPVRVRLSSLRFDANAGPIQDPSSAQRIASDVDVASYQPAFYTELEITPVRGLRLLPGFRVDFIREIRQAILAPRFSARYEFAPGWIAKGGIGLYAQPPGFLESSSAPNTYFPGQTLGNPNLLPQRAMHYGLGFERAFSPWITLSVEGFYKSLEDLVVSAPQADVRLGAPPYTNAGIGRIYGMELLLRHRASERFFGWIAYTLLRSERRDAPDAEWHLYDQDQTHIFTAIASYNLGAGWEVGGRFRYVTGSPTTPVVGSVYNADTFQYVPLYGARNSTRVADFHQLDVRVDKTWRFGWGSLGVFLEVLNVYNHANHEGTIYNYNYTEAQPLTGLPIFPNLGVRGEI
jgi:TonB family protein